MTVLVKIVQRVCMCSLRFLPVLWGPLYDGSVALRLCYPAGVARGFSGVLEYLCASVR